MPSTLVSPASHVCDGRHEGPRTPGPRQRNKSSDGHAGRNRCRHHSVRSQRWVRSGISCRGQPPTAKAGVVRAYGHGKPGSVNNNLPWRRLLPLPRPRCGRFLGFAGRIKGQRRGRAVTLGRIENKLRRCAGGRGKSALGSIVLVCWLVERHAVKFNIELVDDSAVFLVFNPARTTAIT